MSTIKIPSMGQLRSMALSAPLSLDVSMMKRPSGSDRSCQCACVPMFPEEYCSTETKDPYRLEMWRAAVYSLLVIGHSLNIVLLLFGLQSLLWKVISDANPWRLAYMTIRPLFCYRIPRLFFLLTLPDNIGLLHG
jgi:hypothetical protein